MMTEQRKVLDVIEDTEKALAAGKMLSALSIKYASSTMPSLAELWTPILAILRNMRPEDEESDDR